jgi:hypothetical protein
VVFKIRGTKFPEIASRYGEWQVQGNFRVFSTQRKPLLKRPRKTWKPESFLTMKDPAAFAPVI